MNPTTDPAEGSSSKAPAPAKPGPSAIAQAYQNAAASLGVEDADLERRDLRLSQLRGITFLAAGGSGLFALFETSQFSWLVAALAASVFLVLLVLHARVSTRRFGIQRRQRLLDAGLARIAGTYRSEAEETHRRGEGLGEDCNYAKDLDLFGANSLFEQLNTTQTAAGRLKLAGWLSEAAAPETTLARQAAATELVERSDFRQEMALVGMQSKNLHEDAAELIAWTQQPATTKLATFVAFGGLLLLLQLSLAILAFGMDFAWAAKGWLVCVAIQVIALAQFRPAIEPVIGPVSSTATPLGRLHELVATVEAQSFQNERLAAMHKAVSGASSKLRKLDSLVGYAAIRHNGFAGLVANFFLMWDLWCAWRLHGWQQREGQAVEGWLEAMGELEALAALATFAAEHPDFCWPTLLGTTTGEKAAPSLIAEGLAHPLLPAADRVANSIELSDAPCALMITGSNMSGKSTMLRSVGVAAVMAQAGAPVCAKSMRLSPLRIRSSVRVDDDLSQGVSHFYAEVKRLKQVVDSVAQAGPPVLFLLDEVLHGTNSRERVIGAKAVVRYLVDQGAIGAVTSHDLGLTELAAETDGAVRNVHFEDQLSEGEMYFDYTMKAGPVETSNALRLMRSAGIAIVPLD